MTTRLLLDLPAGYFAVADPDDSGVVTAWRWKPGRAGGLQRFTGGATYGEPSRPSRGSPRPPITLAARLSYRDWLKQVVAAVAADPVGASVRFAETTGRCRCCGRKLTDARSVALGIGPECRKESR